MFTFRSFLNNGTYAFDNNGWAMGIEERLEESKERTSLYGFSTQLVKCCPHGRRNYTVNRAYLEFLCCAILKEQCRESFCFWFFSWLSFPPAQSIPKVSKRNKENFYDWRFYPFDTGGAPWAANISANFQKNLKRPYWYNQGLGGNWFMKKTSSKKSRDTVPLRKCNKRTTDWLSSLVKMHISGCGNIWLTVYSTWLTPLGWSWLWEPGETRVRSLKTTLAIFLFHTYSMGTRNTLRKPLHRERLCIV